MEEEFVDCALCGQDMREVSDSCDCTGVFLCNPCEELAPVPFWGPGYCEGCNVAHGGVHHFGCEFELCPRCHEPLRTCGHDEVCDDEEDEDFDDEDDPDDEDPDDEDPDDEDPDEPSPWVDPETSCALEEPSCC